MVRNMTDMKRLKSSRFDEPQDKGVKPAGDAGVEGAQGEGKVL